MLAPPLLPVEPYEPAEDGGDSWAQASGELVYHNYAVRTARMDESPRPCSLRFCGTDSYVACMDG